MAWCLPDSKHESEIYITKKKIDFQSFLRSSPRKKKEEEEAHAVKEETYNNHLSPAPF